MIFVIVRAEGYGWAEEGAYHRSQTEIPTKNQSQIPLIIIIPHPVLQHAYIELIHKRIDGRLVAGQVLRARGGFAEETHLARQSLDRVVRSEGMRRNQSVCGNSDQHLLK